MTAVWSASKQSFLILSAKLEPLMWVKPDELTAFGNLVEVSSVTYEQIRTVAADEVAEGCASR